VRYKWGGGKGILEKGVIIMEKSKESAVEIEMKEMIKECSDIVDCNYLTTQDAKQIIKLLVKALEKCQELRLSRDNWRNKYEKVSG